VAAVEALQEDAGLPVTGVVDRATSLALDAAVVAEKGQDAAELALQTVAVQTALKVTGFWDGPVDGEWTDELTEALKDFQEALGVEPTGEVDAETLAAFEEFLEEGPPEETTEPPDSPEPPETTEPVETETT
jgi:peptidoglycan hydrolase-like protein with peptidoglycan-binding domain